MTRIFNIASDTFIRQRLRRASPKPELVLWRKLQRKQLDGIKFRRQYGVCHFVVDFYCPQHKIAIEIDGSSHLRKKTIKYDLVRQQIIESFGIRIVRFTNEEIYHNLESVLKRICEACKRPQTQ